MSTIAEKLNTTITNKENIKNAIDDKRLEQEQEFDSTVQIIGSITTDMSQWPGIINNLTPKYNTAGGNHCDSNGIWHKPAAWPDIESLPIPEDLDIVYLLYDNHLTHNAFASFTASRVSGILRIDKGHIYDGEFIVDELLYNGNGNKAISELLYSSQEDYTIYRIQAENGLTNIYTSAYGSAANPPYYARVQSTCIMRYGQMKWATPPSSASQWFTSIYLESDNIINYMAARRDYSCSLAQMYNNCVNLQRWRHTGWNLANNRITSLNQMFRACVALSDIDSDFSGFVTSYTTNLDNMFYYCSSIKTINTTGWTTNNVTTIYYMFAYCISLKEIKGIEDWNLSNVTTVAYAFSNCRELRGDLNLENWQISNKCTTTTNFLTYCSKVDKVSIKGWDLSKITNCSNMFSNDTNLSYIDMTNITPPTNVCTSFGVFAIWDINLKEIIFDGWDFSGVTATGGLYQMAMYCYGLQKLIFTNCTFPSTTLDTQTASHYIWDYITAAKYVDIRDLDARIYTGTQMTNMLVRLTSCVDLYPPQHLNKAFSINSTYCLSHDSLLRILNNLDQVSGITANFGAYYRSMLSAAEIAIGTDKGWTIA